MFERVMLEPEQEQLLATLVEAQRNVPRAERQPFLLAESFDGVDVLHRGLKTSKVGAPRSDFEMLARVGLLAQSLTSRGSPRFDVTPQGYAFYDEMKRRVGGSGQRLEMEVRQYLDSPDFQRRYPTAFGKWAQAEVLLWGTDSEQQLTTIGHICREAIQEFATALVNRFQPPDAATDKAKDINRIKAVLDQQREKLGERERKLLEALLDYWRAVSGLVQRQEHGSQPDAPPLLWEDGRRVVFQTAFVMFELDQSLSRPS
jgi:hypothetical protein